MKFKNIIDFFRGKEYNINKKTKEKERNQMREKLMAMKAEAERDILYAQAKLEVIGNLLAVDTEVVAPTPVVDELDACACVANDSIDTI